MYDGCRIEDPRVIDQNVDVAEPFHRLIDQAADNSGIRDVTLNGNGRGVRRNQFLCGLFRRVCVEVVNHQPGAE